MRIVALETATRQGSVALFDGGELVERDVDLRGDGAVDGLARLLAECGVAPSAVDAVAVSVGPGSFTGVRIGVAAAQGFCLGRGIPAVAVGTLDGLAWSCLETEWGVEGTLLLPSVDARRNEVYASLYRVGAPGSPPEAVWGPEPVSPPALAQRFVEVRPEGGRTGEAVLCGDGAASLAPLFGGEAGWSMPAALSRTRASAVARAALSKVGRGATTPPRSLEPVYLRKSDAEINREKRAPQH